MPAKKKRIASTQPHEVTTEEPVSNEKTLRTVVSINDEQRELIKTIHRNDIIIITGCAGSGKTHISVGMAAEYLKRKLVDRIILSRPIVASENIGFLPGSSDEKHDPYLLPLYELLSQFIGLRQALNHKKIITIPVAFMRGHTFNNSFIIIDEAENLTEVQLKLILTRFGVGSKLILNGDITQSDLDDRHKNDFGKVIRKLRKIAGDINKIAIVDLQYSVRNPLIEVIIEALNEN